MRYNTGSPEETKRLGQEWGEKLGGGEVLLLVGPLGAGKTTFVQGLAEGLGAQGPVISPTFVLERRYPGRVELLHRDLYRLESLDEAGGVGEWTPAQHEVLVVEWADKFPELFEAINPTLITFEPGDAGHTISVQGDE